MTPSHGVWGMFPLNSNVTTGQRREPGTCRNLQIDSRNVEDEDDARASSGKSGRRAGTWN
jgi:hypothetical protein